MSAAGWVVVGIAGWCVVAVLAGLLIGRTIRVRDQQAPAKNGEER